MLFLFKLISGEGIESPSVVEEFVEWEEHEKGFNKHYQKYLKGPIEKFERNRIKALVTARRRLFISIPIIFVLFLFLVSVLDDVNSKNDFPFRSLLAAIAFLTFDYFLIKEPILKYWDDVKTEIFPHILSFLGNFTYSVEMEDFYIDRYESYDIVPQHDCSYFEDLIVGEYNGVEITLFESVLENRRYKKQRSYIVFEGVVLKLSINKKFHGKTIIRRDLGGLDNWITDKLSDLDVVNLEDPEFEKQFEVLSTNGDTFLGGEDFDLRLINYLADEFKKDHGMDLHSDPLALQRLRRTREAAPAVGSSPGPAPDTQTHGEPAPGLVAGGDLRPEQQFPAASERSGAQVRPPGGAEAHGVGRVFQLLQVWPAHSRDGLGFQGGEVSDHCPAGDAPARVRQRPAMGALPHAGQGRPKAD